MAVKAVHVTDCQGKSLSGMAVAVRYGKVLFGAARNGRAV